MAIYAIFIGWQRLQGYLRTQKLRDPHDL